MKKQYFLHGTGNVRQECVAANGSEMPAGRIAGSGLEMPAVRREKKNRAARPWCGEAAREETAFCIRSRRRESADKYNFSLRWFC